MTHWIRLEVVANPDGPFGVDVIRHAYPVDGITAKGAWLIVNGARRWVSAGDQNAFASPTDEIALARLAVQQQARRAAARAEHDQSIEVDVLARIAVGAASDEPEDEPEGPVMLLTEAGMAYVTEAVLASLGMVDAEAAFS